ncbi:MAG: nickel-responsive transcriptional regulator NikR [Candidatus Brocadiia bacterium]
MSDTVRFGVSLSMDLLDRFDRLIKELGYDNRSEAMRDLIRRKLLEEEWEAPDKETFAAVFLVYDHHTMSLASRLMDVQHESFAQVIGSFHVHADRHNCLEVIVLRGKGPEIRDLADRMISLKGVKYGRLNMGTTAGMVH